MKALWILDACALAFGQQARQAMVDRRYEEAARLGQLPPSLGVGQVPDLPRRR